MKTVGDICCFRTQVELIVRSSGWNLKLTWFVVFRWSAGYEMANLFNIGNTAFYYNDNLIDDKIDIRNTYRFSAYFDNRE